MGTGRPRSFACALVALAFLAAVAPASPASATPKGKHHRTFRFGTRPLAPGAKGKDVRYLQRALTRLGVATSIDGVFGKGTFKSVETFEQQRGWPVNGTVSKKDAKRIRKLLTKNQASGSYFVVGLTSPTLAVHAKRAGSANVKVMDASGNVLEAIGVSLSAGDSQNVSWNGIVSGSVVPDGTYQLKLADPDSIGATASGQTQPFVMHLHAFPLLGPHNFGGPDARFGAPRSGHIHQGQDVVAACGQKEIVDESGQVRVNAYQASDAGYYVVLHGGLTGTDSVYMHLAAPSWAPVGTSVYAGQQIGKVGATGDATGCHLHFERWSAPGWYVGGAAYDPLPELQYWDTYS
jgi:peptidoglycan hydrolase-like protein with peptidoglycan-binding domain